MQLNLLGFCFTDAHGLAPAHDPLLVALSYAVAVGGSFTALEMIERWRNSRGTAVIFWQLASAIALGGSIWSMHFIGLLALRTAFPLTYALGPTLLSFLVAIVAVGCGLQILDRRISWLRLGGAGLIVGLGIAAMHYLGMSSVRFPGSLAYRPGLWSVSLLVGIAAAIVALWLSFTLQRRWHRAVAALAMAAAICGMHYTGMAATVFNVDPLVHAEPGLPSGPMAIAVFVTVSALISSALVLVMADRRVFAATAREADTLRRSNAQLAESNAALQRDHRQFQAVLDNIIQGICLFDGEMRLQVCNRRHAEIYGLPPAAALPGLTLAEILDFRFAAGATPDMTRAEYLAAAFRTVAAREVSDRVTALKNGRIVAIHHQPMPNGGWVATHEDITEKQQAQADIAFLSRHDVLTQLPNRLLFTERFGQAMAKVHRGARCAVLCINLDHFKSVNDTLGHPIGDALLQAAAERLRGCIRDGDTVARLGGDEFGIIQLAAELPGDAERLAIRINAAFQNPFDIAGHQVIVSTSIGVATAPSDGASCDSLLKSADIALYLAKTDGRGAVRFFEPEMDTRIQLRRKLEMDLRNALDRHEFELYYQPSISLDTGNVAGFEALLRWRHPTRGLVSPADFIPVTEETGLIVAIGEWVIRTACSEAMTWPDDFTVAVNLSSVQFVHGELVATVRSALADSGLPPNRLELEITESILLQDSAGTLSALRQLRDLGISIALDDFGTGYSSLSYLRSFPFDRIKIDQSFVRDMPDNKDAMAIVRATTGLAKSLRMRTTAEGVETREQLEKLRAKGCTEVQGYLFSRPLPPSELHAWLQSLHVSNKLVVQHSGSFHEGFGSVS